MKSKKPKSGKVERRKAIKIVECWAPVVKATGAIHLQEKHIQRVKPPDDFGGWNGEPLTYIRVRIVPITTKRKA